MKNLREYVQKLAALDSHVLFVGEPGSGRSAFASYLHSLSDRSAGRLVTVLGASLTDENVEEALFGSEKGDEIHTGYLERAENGTLVIDELSDLSEKAQKLVQSAIDQGSFTRLGGKNPIELRARVVGTVDADYEALIDSGDLRRDLIASLSTLTAQVPPLREYAEDVPELLNYYVDRLVDTDGAKFRRFSVAAQNRLRNYPWPDNVRELKNLVQRLLLTGEDEEITLEEIESEIRARSTADEPLVKQDLLSLPLREAREQFERAYLQQQLVLCDGKVGKLASRVGMERTHLYRKLRSLGVDFRSVGSDD
jgi:DNA-binding NtrC family response regulator